jgi:hypothetical protein
VLTRHGRLAEALEHGQRSTALFLALDHWPALNACRNVQGKVLRMLGRYDEALTAHRTVLADLSGRTDQMAPDVLRYHQAYTLELIGEIMLDLRDWSQASTTFHDARALITTTEQPKHAGEATFHEGMARRRAGEHAKAAECLRSALTLFTDVPARWWRARTLAELAATLDATGDIDEADHHRREALALCQLLDTDQARTLAAELSPTVT